MRINSAYIKIVENQGLFNCWENTVMKFNYQRFCGGGDLIGFRDLFVWLVFVSQKKETGLIKTQKRQN